MLVQYSTRKTVNYIREEVYERSERFERVGSMRLKKKNIHSESP